MSAAAKKESSREADQPRMTMRVYTIHPNGTETGVFPTVEVRAGEVADKCNPIHFPPCQCKRCTGGS